jgi:hypothetical protein
VYPCTSADATVYEPRFESPAATIILTGAPAASLILGSTEGVKSTKVKGNYLFQKTLRACGDMLQLGCS